MGNRRSRRKRRQEAAKKAEKALKDSISGNVDHSYTFTTLRHSFSVADSITRMREQIEQMRVNGEWPPTIPIPIINRAAFKMLGISMSSEERALKEAARVDPNNTTPQLIYADWLDEQNRGDEATKIRQKCYLLAIALEPFNKQPRREYVDWLLENDTGDKTDDNPRGNDFGAMARQIDRCLFYDEQHKVVRGDGSEVRIVMHCCGSLIETIEIHQAYYRSESANNPTWLLGWLNAFTRAELFRTNPIQKITVIGMEPSHHRYSNVGVSRYNWGNLPTPLRPERKNKRETTIAFGATYAPPPIGYLYKQDAIADMERHLVNIGRTAAKLPKLEALQ